MKRSLSILFVLLLSVSAVAAQKLPEGYNGLIWGSDFDEAIPKVNSFPISSSITPKYGTSSIFSLLTDDPEMCNVTLLYWDKKLYQVNCELKVPADKMIEKMKKLYGAPQTDKETLKEYGSTFQRTSWNDGVTLIVVDEIGGKVYSRSISMKNQPPLVKTLKYQMIMEIKNK